MRLPLILTLALAAATAVPANAYQKPRVKPQYSSEKPTRSNGGGRVATSDRSTSSTAQELRRVEQSSAKVNGAGKNGEKKVSSPALKPDKGGTNPPIRLSGNGKGNGPRGKTADPSKGRLRQKNH